MANCVKSSWLLLTACQTVQTQRYKETQTQRDKATQTERQRHRHTLLIDSAVHHHVLSQPPDILRSDENMRLQWSVWFDIMLKRLNTCFIVVFIVSWVNVTVGIEDVQFISRYSSVHWIYTHTFFFPPIPQMNVVLKPLSETCMNNEGRIFYSPTTRMTVSRVHTLTAPSVLSERFSVPWEVIIKNVKNLISQC